jgi:hypothetical protein
MAENDGADGAGDIADTEAQQRQQRAGGRSTLTKNTLGKISAAAVP